MLRDCGSRDWSHLRADATLSGHSRPGHSAASEWKFHCAVHHNSVPAPGNYQGIPPTIILPVNELAYRGQFAGLPRKPRSGMLTNHDTNACTRSGGNLQR